MKKGGKKKQTDVDCKVKSIRREVCLRRCKRALWENERERENYVVIKSLEGYLLGWSKKEGPWERGKERDMVF